MLIGTRLELAEFDMDNGTPLGCGALAVVNRTLHRPTQRHFAVKIVSKLQLIQLHKVEAAKAEKAVLYALGPHAGIVYLHGTMQSEDELYYVLDLLPNGDLLEHIRRVAGKRRMSGDDQSSTAPTPCLSLHDTHLIAAQLVDLLAHVFKRGYILRDLKPENVVFDVDFRCVLVDFDTAMASTERPVSNEGIALERDRLKAKAAARGELVDLPEPRKVRKVSEIQAIRRNTSAFCGTAHYVAPESLGECKYTYASDLFALGCVVFHMLAGRPLFNGASSFFVMKDIKDGVGRKVFPSSVTRHPGAEAFIRQLAHTDPVERLGVDPETQEFNIELIKSHAFFAGFDWKKAAYPPAAVREPLQPAPASQRNQVPPPTYDDSPMHTDEYAEYVMQAGDSAFERYATGEEDPSAAPPSNSSPSHDMPQDDSEQPQQLGSSSDEDEVVSIEDDVGIACATTDEGIADGSDAATDE
jgi:serine/threonine protein kinase